MPFGLDFELPKFFSCWFVASRELVAAMHRLFRLPETRGCRRSLHTFTSFVSISTIKTLEVCVLLTELSASIHQSDDSPCLVALRLLVANGGEVWNAVLLSEELLVGSEGLQPTGR